MSGGRHIRVAQICCAIDGALWMVDLAASLQARGFDVLAVVPSREGTTADALTAAGVRLLVSPQYLDGALTRRAMGAARRVPRVGKGLTAVVRAVGALALSLKMARILRREQIDIAHTQIFQSMIIGRIAAWIARVPIRISMVPGPFHLEVPATRRLDLATQWMDHVVVAGSGYVDELYRRAGIPAARRRVIPYAADQRVFDPEHADGRRVRAELGISPNTPLVGQVAWFYPPTRAEAAPPLVGDRGLKGHEDFVDAARLVLAERPDTRFLLVGAGWGPKGEEYRRSVADRCRKLGIDDAVIFTGHRSDVPDVLAALDVAVQCSLSENYGGTISSLMMRTPTIATRVGGMPEVVRHDETGLLVPPRDPPALAAAMLRLLGDPVLAARLAERGRAWVLQGWTRQGMCDAVALLYAEELRKRLPGRVAPAGSGTPSVPSSRVRG